MGGGGGWTTGGTLTGVMVTLAWARSVTVVPSSSTAMTVTVSVWASPARPRNSPSKAQLYLPPLGARVMPMAQLPRPLRSP